MISLCYQRHYFFRAKGEKSDVLGGDFLPSGVNLLIYFRVCASQKNHFPAGLELLNKKRSTCYSERSEELAETAAHVSEPKDVAP